MMSSAVMQPSYGKRKSIASPFTKRAIDFSKALRNESRVLNSAQLLARLTDRGVKNVQIARALAIPESRVTEMRSGKRRIKLDEAAKLVDAFELETEGGEITPLTTPIARLLVLHLADSLDVDIPEPKLSELAADFRVFSTFVSNPRVRDSVDAAGAFLQGVRLRKQVPAEPGASPRQGQNK
jgi:hypothetical protein